MFASLLLDIAANALSDAETAETASCAEDPLLPSTEWA